MRQSKKEIPKLKRKLIKIFNAFIRARDKKYDGGKCISCGKIGNQAGHYLPISLCPQPSMRFNEKNVHTQCPKCNLWLRGNQHDYAKGLKKRYGEHILEELDIQRSFKSNSWGVFQYQVMIKEYERKILEISGLK